MNPMADGGGDFPPFIEPTVEHRPRVLVVEDDKLAADLTRAVLESSGYSVTCCADGLGAIQELERGDFDCIVLDLRMTTFDGEQLLDLMAFDRPSMRQNVVVVSGYRDRAEKLRGSVGEVLFKPVRRDVLANAVAARIAAAPVE